MRTAGSRTDPRPSTPLGPQSYYYPGGSFGGPVPGTHKKLLFWGGYERWLQNQGNANILTSYIPSPEMMQGDFSTDNADNMAVCPNGFFQGARTRAELDHRAHLPLGLWRQSVVQRPWLARCWRMGTASGVLADPDSDRNLLTGTSELHHGRGAEVSQPGFLDPGAAALAKIWPKANSAPIHRSLRLLYRADSAFATVATTTSRS